MLTCHLSKTSCQVFVLDFVYYNKKNIYVIIIIGMLDTLTHLFRCYFNNLKMAK